MPTLTWATKSLPEITPAALVTDSIIYPKGAGYWVSAEALLPQNCLYLGDNLVVMASLLPAYEGNINLIYVDPPFFTNRAYSARVGRGEDSRRPSKWQLAEIFGRHNKLYSNQEIILSCVLLPLRIK